MKYFTTGRASFWALCGLVAAAAVSVAIVATALARMAGCTDFHQGVVFTLVALCVPKLAVWLLDKADV